MTKAVVVVVSIVVGIVIGGLIGVLASRRGKNKTSEYDDYDKKLKNLVNN
ncbi:hypothetical protein CRE_15646 [Caenorhabditis remanei]|uniref:Uncharacterized protein n=1 Tax=Caenorhabditis remanei TaxID=31234 RepID=E3N845_CAERE|nr:hypothetical protein CRE_15646 [Caenorhabditis remanei]